MELRRFTSALDWERASVDFIKDACKTPSSFATVALSGGATPFPVYQALAADKIFDFTRTEFFMVDERAVNFDDPASNYAAVVRAFQPAGERFLGHFHFFDTALPPPKAARRYARELSGIPGGSFDLIILGLGADGHIASLFPNSPANGDNRHLAISTINENVPALPVRDRLTVTWPVIMSAQRILLLVNGEKKEPIIRELLTGSKPFPEFPARRLTNHPAAAIHFLS